MFAGMWDIELLYSVNHPLMVPLSNIINSRRTTISISDRSIHHSTSLDHSTSPRPILLIGSYLVIIRHPTLELLSLSLVQTCRRYKHPCNFRHGILGLPSAILPRANDDNEGCSWFYKIYEESGVVDIEGVNGLAMHLKTYVIRWLARYLSALPIKKRQRFIFDLYFRHLL